MTHSIYLRVCIFIFFQIIFVINVFATNEQTDANVRRVYEVSHAQNGINIFPNDVLKKIFLSASSNGIDPRHIELVCKKWYCAMRSKSREEGVLFYDASNILYTTQKHDYFMQDCMRRYRESLAAKIQQIEILGEHGLLSQEFVLLSEPTTITDFLRLTRENKSNEPVYYLAPKHLIMYDFPEYLSFNNPFVSIKCDCTCRPEAIIAYAVRDALDESGKVIHLLEAPEETSKPCKSAM